MASELFEEWIQEIDRKMERDGRKICMIVGNCPAHPRIESLVAIDIGFLPPKTTPETQPPETQPMDMGAHVHWLCFRRSLKAKY